MNKCEVCNGTYSLKDIEDCHHEHLIIEDSLYHWDSRFGFEGQLVNYCFNCGKHLTKVKENEKNDAKISKISATYIEKIRQEACCNYIPVNVDEICKKNNIAIEYDASMNFFSLLYGDNFEKNLVLGVFVPGDGVYLNGKILLSSRLSKTESRMLIAEFLGYYFLQNEHNTFVITSNGSRNIKVDMLQDFAFELMMPRYAIEFAHKNSLIIIPREFASLFQVPQRDIYKRFNELGLHYLKHLV